MKIQSRRGLSLNYVCKNPIMEVFCHWIMYPKIQSRKCLSSNLLRGMWGPTIESCEMPTANRRTCHNGHPPSNPRCLSFNYVYENPIAEVFVIRSIARLVGPSQLNGKFYLATSRLILFGDPPHWNPQTRAFRRLSRKSNENRYFVTFENVFVHESDIILCLSRQIFIKKAEDIDTRRLNMCPRNSSAYP